VYISEQLTISSGEGFEGFDRLVEGNPDKASQGTAGPRSAMHVAGAFFQRETGTRFQFVPNPNIGIQDPLDVLRACSNRDGQWYRSRAYYPDARKKMLNR
jgi:hypothetical protein